ncbi:MAG: hypothetical protein V7754_04825 [Halioglobus sp.]
MIGQLDSTQKALLLSLILLPLIAWLGPLEKLSYAYLDETLTNAGLIYATARGINAVISVIQTTEIDAAVVSVQVGQVLDPINDLVERFSAVMLAALGSLALQKIVLELVSDTTFTLLLTVLAACSVTSLLVGDRKFYPYLVRGFWVTVCLRFSLVLVVLANSWIDSAFLADVENERHEEMMLFAEDLNAAKSGSLVDEETLNELDRAKGQYESELQSLKSKLASMNTDYMGKEAELDIARQESLLCKLTLSSQTCSDEVMAAAQAQKELDNRIDVMEDSISAKENQIKTVRESTECLKKRSTGESCGLFDSVKSTLSLEENLKKLDHKVSGFVDSTVNLLVSLLFKTILIPIGFLYLLFRGIGVSWSRMTQLAHERGSAKA